MKFSKLAVVTWLTGLIVFLPAFSLLTGGLGGFLSLAIFVSMGFAAVTVIAVYLPAMLLLRSRTSWATATEWAGAGAVVGLLPGIALGLLAAAVIHVDRAPETVVGLLMSTPGLLGLATGAITGAVFGAGFFRGSAERQ